MSQVQPIGSQAGGEAQVRAAIARAAGATGVDFDFLLAQARIESGLRPHAEAPTSSAAGLYQFTNSTWLRTFARHGEKHGIDWAGAANSDPALRTQAMALRHDPQVSALMAGELANDNRLALSAALGRAPDASELYLAHFLGSAGAGRFLNALASDPSQSAAALLPAAAGANRTIFYAPGGAPRSISEVMGVIRAKVEGAMAADGDATFAVPEWGTPLAVSATGSDLPHSASISAGDRFVPRGPIAQEFHQTAPPPNTRPSMADTLREAFALGTPAGSAAPGHVRTAYARLTALGL